MKKILLLALVLISFSTFAQNHLLEGSCYRAIWDDKDQNYHMPIVVNAFPNDQDVVILYLGTDKFTYTVTNVYKTNDKFKIETLTGTTFLIDLNESTVFIYSKTFLISYYITNKQ